VSTVQTHAQRRRAENDNDATAIGRPHDGSTAGDENASGTHKRRRRRQRRAPLQNVAPNAWQAREIGWTPEVLREMQFMDSDVGPAIVCVESGERPPWPEIQGQSQMLRSLWQQFDSLIILDGVCTIHFMTVMAL